jgi:hypothetical protein
MCTMPCVFFNQQQHFVASRPGLPLPLWIYHWLLSKYFFRMCLFSPSSRSLWADSGRLLTNPTNWNCRTLTARRVLKRCYYCWASNMLRFQRFCCGTRSNIFKWCFAKPVVLKSPFGLVRPEVYWSRPAAPAGISVKPPHFVCQRYGLSGALTESLRLTAA